jgi:hypothetical protein
MEARRRADHRHYAGALPDQHRPGRESRITCNSHAATRSGYREGTTVVRSGRRAVEQATAVCPGGPWTLHQLRHSALTHAAEASANTTTLLAYFGHTSVAPWPATLASHQQPWPAGRLDASGVEPRARHPHIGAHIEVGEIATILDVRFAAAPSCGYDSRGPTSVRNELTSEQDVRQDRRRGRQCIVPCFEQRLAASLAVAARLLPGSGSRKDTDPAEVTR